MPSDILEKAPAQAWSEFTGDSGNIWPDVAFVLVAFPLSRLTEWLAGVSCDKGVDGPGKGSGIEGGDIIPDRGVGHVSGPLGGNEGFAGVWLPLDIAPGMESRLCKTEAHIQSTATCAEGQSVPGTWHHVMPAA